LDDFATLSPGVNISGNVSLGRGAFLGTGAQVAPSVEVGEGVIVGAGATVIKNITSNVVAVGSPAQAIKELTKI
jgi:acetyltransferase-like isoleucine patch superfamily enzyme